MRRPPDKRTAPGASWGGGGSCSGELKSKQQSDPDKEVSPTAQALIEATERAEDLLALYREQRRLSHRVRLARLKFELIGLDPNEHLVDQVGEWGQLVKAFVRAGMHFDDINDDRGGRL